MGKWGTIFTTQGGGPSAGFTCDANGNMTQVTGTLLGAWDSLVYDDLNQLTAVTRPGGYDTYEYNALGQRLRSLINGFTTRYVYFGDRVVEDNSVTGTVLAWHTVSGPGYGDHWLHMKRWNTAHLYPAYDGTGSAREMVDGSGTVSDTYTLDAFGVQLASTGSDPNPYRYDAAWGYLRESSGLYQLGYRFYWPEIGRFIQQDPIGDGMNWYAYVENNPVNYVDPTGQCFVDPLTEAAKKAARRAFQNLQGWLRKRGGYVDLSGAFLVPLRTPLLGLGPLGGVQIGYDPATEGKPEDLLHPSTWHWVHPYLGVGLGSPAGRNYGVMYGPGTPSSGWYAALTGGSQVGLSTGVGPLGNGATPFVEWGYTSPGLTGSLYNVW